MSLTPSPEPPDDPFTLAVAAWIEVIDELTYYEIFGVTPRADTDEVREAFHMFCDVFHPDRHFARPRGEREVLSAIFKRGTEAYLVLCDRALRERYDAQIGGAAAVAPRLSMSPHSPHSTASPSTSPFGTSVKLEDVVRSPSARPFARRADELMQKGDFKQAKLQLVMANFKDPLNEALAAALKDIESRIGKPPGRG
ncbi:MAG: J domain-containing protein [Polyangiaceae bacterium]